jgi:predicted RecB family nuclease
MGSFLTREIFGAYPAKDWLKCAEKVRKEVSYDEGLKAPYSDGVLARMAAGVEFEDVETDKMVESWSAEGWDVIDIVVTKGTTRKVGPLVKDYEALIGSRSRRKRALRVRAGDRETRTRNAVERLSRAAVAAGVHIILGGRFTCGQRVGEIDMLVRCNPDTVGRKQHTYVSVDLKHHQALKGTAAERPFTVTDPLDPFLETGARTEMLVGTPQDVDSLQLCHYWYILDDLGVAGPRVGGIYGTDGFIVYRGLDVPFYRYNKVSAFELYDEAWDGLLSAVRHERERLLNPALEPLSSPEWQTECKECPWREVCHEELVADRHITLLPGLTPRRAVPHYEAGVYDYLQLASLDHRTARIVASGVDLATLILSAEQRPASTPVSKFAGPSASALVAEGVRTAADVVSLDRVAATYSKAAAKALPGFIDQARVTQAQRVHRARGVSHVNRLTETAITLDVDIEDDSGGFCYMIGVLETVKGQSRYLPFVTWETTPDAEAQVFADFWTYVQATITNARRSKLGAVRAYYYTQHETRFFRALATRHAGYPGVPTIEELDEFLCSEMWVDMHPVLTEDLVWPTEDHTLKTIAKYTKFSWRDDSPSGSNSVAWYRTAIDDESPDRDDMRQRLLEYNEDDVRATKRIREFLNALGAARRPGLKVPSVADLDRRYALRAQNRRAAA